MIRVQIPLDMEWFITTETSNIDLPAAHYDIIFTLATDFP